MTNIFELLVGIVIMFAFVCVVNAPEFLAGWAADRRRGAEVEAAQLAEIDRKLIIAEAANAARARGETFVPPVDYDR